MRSVHPVARLIARSIRALSGVQVRGAHGTEEQKQRIYFSNHTSHLDFPVIWSALPADAQARTHPVAAMPYWEKGWRGYVARKLFGAVLVQRSSRPRGDHSPEAIAQANTVVDQMAEAIGETESLILFPEGTRSTDESVASFRSGLYYLARKKPSAELVPVCVENLARILPKGEALPVPLIGALTFGEPLQVGDDEPKEAFLERAHAAVLALRRQAHA